MTQIFHCGDRETLTAFLYEDCSPAVREAVSTHLLHCGPCAGEVAALGALRLELASWRVPEPRVRLTTAALAALDAGRRNRGLGGADASATRLRWWARPLPGWAQAAAAVAIFTAGLAIGAAQSGLGLVADHATGTRTASSERGASARDESTIQPVVAHAAAPVTAADLAALEARLRVEMRADLLADVADRMTTTRRPISASPNEDALLGRVRAMIAESERRQQTELALRTAQVTRQVDTQRRVDLVQLQRRIGDVQELTGAAVRDQGQMVNYLYNVSQRR